MDSLSRKVVSSTACLLVGFRESCELLHLRGVLNFFLCFRSELATEVLLHGTIRLDSKICSQNVHFHDSLWREQTLAATKYCFCHQHASILPHSFLVAVCISSRAVRVFPSTITRTALIWDLFCYGFARKLRAGPYGSYDNILYFQLSTFGRNQDFAIQISLRFLILRPDVYR